MRLPSVRRNDRRTAPAGTGRGRTATVERDRGPVDSRRTGEPAGPAAAHSRKIEQAAEKAADATRTAAARAATELSRARPRTSAAAVLSLVLAVVAGLGVVSGVLAGLGVGLGAVAVVFGLAGLSATRRRYRRLAGRSLAVVGLLLGLAAVVVGWLALAGGLPWLDTGADRVARLRDVLPGWLG